LTIVETCAITGGVDTHADVHVAAALDPVGGLLGAGEFPATLAGYARLLGWLGGFGTVALVGIEGTGSYGAGLARHITAAGIRGGPYRRAGTALGVRVSSAAMMNSCALARMSRRSAAGPGCPSRRGSPG
jgi:transposase